MGFGAEEANDRDFHFFMLGESDFDEDITETADGELSEFQYKEIKWETPKAWLLEMSGGAQRWWPKSCCVLLDDIVIVPNWLVEKIIAEEGRIKSKSKS